MRPLLLVFILTGCRLAPAPSPHTSQQESPVRGLSRQEVEDLLAGRGAGYARTAELNSYPGPRHVLDLGSRLELSAEQRERTQAVFDSMQRDARRLGEEIVDRERALAGAFATRAISAEQLQASVDSLAALYGRLRGTHLRAHLATAAILSPEQVRAYDRLRGYGDRTAEHQTHVRGAGS